MNPKQKIFAEHDIPSLTNEAMAFQELSELGQAIFNAKPAGVAESTVGVGVGAGSLIEAGAGVIGLVGHDLRVAGPRAGGRTTSIIETLPPYETAEPEETVGAASLQTSLLRAPITDYPNNKQVAKEEITDKLVLFAVHPSGVNIAPADMSVGKNVRYGALLGDSGKNVKFIRFAVSSGDTILQSVQRKDPTEESGVATDSSLVKHGEARVVASPVEVFSEEYFELLDELKKAQEAYKSASISSSADVSEQ